MATSKWTTDVRIEKGGTFKVEGSKSYDVKQIADNALATAIRITSKEPFSVAVYKRPDEHILARAHEQVQYTLKPKN